MQAIWTGHGRALTNGALFDQQGTMVASTAQEGMIRPRSTTST
jgi:acyl-CoA thioesterase-2